MFAKVILAAAILLVAASGMHVDVNPSKMQKQSSEKLAFNVRALISLTDDEAYSAELVEALSHYGRDLDVCAFTFVGCNENRMPTSLTLADVHGHVDLDGIRHLDSLHIENSVIDNFSLESVPPMVRTLYLSNVTIGRGKWVMRFPKRRMRLRRLTIRNSGLTGVEWADAPPLEHVDLSGNRLPASAMPTQLKHPLTYLNMSRCSISGTLPTGFAASFKALRVLDLSHNDLQGELPCNELDVVEYLDLSFNRFTGPLCVSLSGEVVNLQLAFNRLSGAIGDLREAWSLQVLNLTGNEISELEAFDLLPPEITRLSVSGNKLTTLPQLKPPPSLQQLDLSNNSITGTFNFGGLPDGFLDLNLAHNRFTGVANVEAAPRSIERIQIQHNAFSGDVHVTSLPLLLRSVVFHHNKFTVALPPEFEQHSEL
jgi:Leucine-rich repeat (LRR) protein